MIEVYPHPAIVGLTGAVERLKYKASKERKLWPGLTALARRENIIRELARIETSLAAHIDSIILPRIPPTSATRMLKALEDAIDALVCAWVGVEYRAGRARAYGDETAAIWIPDSGNAGN